MFSLDDYQTLLAGAGIIRREDRGRILLRGTDRLSYLHGLLTQDILGLAPGTGRYAALLTAQGRMIADMRVFELGDRALVELDASLATQISEHFDRFVITEDVAIEDISASTAQIGVYGPTASQVVQRARARIPAATLLAGRSDDLGVTGVDVVVAMELADDFVRACEADGAAAVSRDALEVMRVEAGVPRFLVDMDATTIPLEAGIEDRAISMTKGCYVGQEVIIRVLHRGGGRVAKKLVGLKPEKEVARGDRLSSGDREIGVVTSAVVSPRFGPVALGYVQREFVEPGTSVSVRNDGGRVAGRVARVPFAPVPA